MKGAFYAPGGCDWRGRVAIAEGPCDAIALRWMHRGATVLATGGTAGLLALDPRPFVEALEVVVEGDGDRPGRGAATTAVRALVSAGVPARAVFRTAGDPAADWRDEFSGAESALGLQAAWRQARDGAMWPQGPRAEPVESTVPGDLAELYADAFGMAGHDAALDDARRRADDGDFPSEATVAQTTRPLALTQPARSRRAGAIFSKSPRPALSSPR